MNTAKNVEVRFYDQRKLLRILISIVSVVVTAISTVGAIVAEVALQTGSSLPYLSILGVTMGWALAFFGLNWDVYSETRRDLFSMFAINISVLVPGTLLGISTHQWNAVLRVVGMACVGFTWGWYLSKSVTRRYGLERNNLLSTIRTVLSMMLVACATYVYILLHVAEMR